MDSKKSFDLAKAIVVNYVNAHASQSDSLYIDMDEVEFVWASRNGDELKILLRTTTENGMYYQVTCVEDEREAHLDIYKSFESSRIRF